MLGEYEKGLLITNQGRVMYKLTSVIPTSRMALYYAVCCSESEGRRENLTSQKSILRKMVIFFVFFVLRTEKRLKNVCTYGFEERCFSSCYERGMLKNYESPWGIGPQTFGFRAPMLYHWATETLWWARFTTKFICHASYILLGSSMSIASCLWIEYVSYELRNRPRSP